MAHNAAQTKFVTKCREMNDVLSQNWKKECPELAIQAFNELIIGVGYNGDILAEEREMGIFCEALSTDKIQFVFHKQHICGNKIKPVIKIQYPQVDYCTFSEMLPIWEQDRNKYYNKIVISINTWIGKPDYARNQNVYHLRTICGVSCPGMARQLMGVYDLNNSILNGRKSGLNIIVKSTHILKIQI